MQRQKLYEQNRANMRERMRLLKEFIKEKKNISKTNEEFFEENKEYFAQYEIKNYSELEKLINTYDKENPEELEKEEREKYIKHLKIEHIENKDLQIIQEKKKFNNLNIISINGNSNIHITNSDNYFEHLEKINKENEYNYNPELKEYITYKSKIYQIKNVNKGEIISSKKIKYNERDLIKSSNIINISYNKIPKNKICEDINYTENGIQIDELKKIKIKELLKDLSEEDKKNLEKVEQILNNIIKKEENNSNYENSFCIKCNKSFKNENYIEHKGHSIIQIDNYKDIDLDSKDLNYNKCLEKLYEKLKKDQKLLLKSKKNKLITYYGKIIFSLYDIISNNFSIELLNSSIITINKDYNNEKELKIFDHFFMDYFLIYIEKILKLTYSKRKKIEELLIEIKDEDEIGDSEIFENKEDGILKSGNNRIYNAEETNTSNNFDKVKINFDEFRDEDKRDYFLKLGLNLKYEYGKKESITSLYNIAKEKNIYPIDYENFIKKELNIIS